jgi:hypothetical protein
LTTPKLQAADGARPIGAARKLAASAASNTWWPLKLKKINVHSESNE